MFDIRNPKKEGGAVVKKELDAPQYESLADSSLGLAQKIVENLLLTDIKKISDFASNVYYTMGELSRLRRQDAKYNLDLDKPLALAAYFYSDFIEAKEDLSDGPIYKFTREYFPDSPYIVKIQLWDAFNFRNRFKNDAGNNALELISDDDARLIQENVHFFATNNNSNIGQSFNDFFKERELVIKRSNSLKNFQEMEGDPDEEIDEIVPYKFDQLDSILNFMNSLSLKQDNEALKYLSMINDDFQRAEMLAVTAKFIIENKDQLPNMVKELQEEMAKNQLSIDHLLTQ